MVKDRAATQTSEENCRDYVQTKGSRKSPAQAGIANGDESLDLP